MLMNDDSVKSEERLLNLMNSLADHGFVSLSNEGNVQSWSIGAENITGYSVKEVLGKNISFLYLPEDREPALWASEAQSARAKKRHESEGWRLRKDGTKFWANVVITETAGPAGSNGGFGMVLRDFTSKREADEALRKSEERYRLLVTNVKDYAIFLVNPEGIVMTWNTGAELLKGYKAHEIIGKHFSTFYSQFDKDRKHPQNELKIAAATGRHEEEGWRIRKDGSRFWANIILTRLLDGTGKHIGFAKITRDLTERKHAEEILRESEERFRLMIDSVKDYSIIMLSPDGLITSWNEGAQRMKGYSASEIYGKHFSAFYEPEEVAVGKCEYELREATATGRFEDEGWRVRKDGTKFWANVVITALRDAKGELRGFSKVTRDTTERKRTEDKLRMAQESLELRVASRTKELEAAIESRDEFLSIASHELRTPLTALKLQQQIFARELNKLTKGEGVPLTRATEVSEMTKRQVAQLSRLVDDMLDVSRISTGRLRVELQAGSLSDLASRVFKSFEPQFDSAGVKATLDIREELRANFDPHRIEQVISNLLSNAVKYGAGSPVSMSVRRVGSQAEIEVRDEGPGISQADQARIFKRYERAISANEVSGLGLGLFISEQILQSHGGHVHVESDLQKGSRFIVTLPLIK
jgi:PAS domain S-box-containing protein